jgi:demethylspheroidene O-methyltransferase
MRPIDRWYRLRDRLLADPRFQRFAAAFPLTRPIARRRARGLFDVVAGFVYSQVLAAAVEVGLFDVLADGPQTAAAIGRRTGLPEQGAHRLLAAAAALDLAQPRGTDAGGTPLWGLGAQGAAMTANPGIAEMVRHHALLYADLADPVALLKGENRDTALSRFWAYARSDNPGEADAEAVAAYSRLMAATQPMIAEEVLAAYPVRRHRVLMDVGGGEGAFLIHAAAAAPDLEVRLFDLPSVAARAAQRFAAAGLADRARVHGGSFLTDPLPRGADLISLVRIVHDHDDPQALAILRAVRAALPDDGTLLLAEPMSGTADAEPIGDAYFGFYLMAMGSGRPRTAAELEDLLHAAGFGRVRHRRTRRPMLTRVLSARPA